MASACISRTPLLDRYQQIVGYEIYMQPIPGMLRLPDLTGALSILGEIDTTPLLDTTLILILAGKGQCPVPDALPPHSTLSFVLDSRVDAIAQPSGLLSALHSHGYGVLNLNGHRKDAANLPPSQAPSYVKLDVEDLSVEALHQELQRLRESHRQIIASGVESRQAFQNTFDIGFDIFQGSYFTHPETLAEQNIHASFTHILTLLNQLRQNAEIVEIEQVLKSDAATSYKLLQYVNSAGFSFNQKISSFRQAVTLLGYQKLYRWLTLLLVNVSKEAGAPPALLKTAVIRARLAECIGQRLPPDCYLDGDNLFIVGLFSLLDTLFDMPMARVLETVSLPPNLEAALLTREGGYGEVLKVVEAAEWPNTDELSARVLQLGLTPAQFNQCHIDAISWLEHFRL